MSPRAPTLRLRGWPVRRALRFAARWHEPLYVWLYPPDYRSWNKDGSGRPW